MSKNEISVFNTEAYKAKLKHKEYKKEYRKKYIITETISKGINKRTNLKTNHISYQLGENFNGKVFKTLEEAIRYRFIHSNLINLRSIQTENKTKSSYITIEPNIRYNPTVNSYIVAISINKKQIHKTFYTLKEAQIFKAKILKQKNLIKKLTVKTSINKRQQFKEYNQKYKNLIRIEKYIRKIINIKTNHITFIAQMTYKGQSISKIFPTLKEAQTFKLSIMKQKLSITNQ